VELKKALELLKNTVTNFSSTIKILAIPNRLQVSLAVQILLLQKWSMKDWNLSFANPKILHGENLFLLMNMLLQKIQKQGVSLSLLLL
jgi:hypothetical protein